MTAQVACPGGHRWGASKLARQFRQPLKHEVLVIGALQRIGLEPGFSYGIIPTSQVFAVPICLSYSGFPLKASAAKRTAAVFSRGASDLRDIWRGHFAHVIPRILIGGVFLLIHHGPLQPALMPHDA